MTLDEHDAIESLLWNQIRKLAPFDATVQLRRADGQLVAGTWAGSILADYENLRNMVKELEERLNQE